MESGALRTSDISGLQSSLAAAARWRDGRPWRTELSQPLQQRRHLPSNLTPPDSPGSPPSSTKYDNNVSQLLEQRPSTAPEQLRAIPRDHTQSVDDYVGFEQVSESGHSNSSQDAERMPKSPLRNILLTPNASPDSGVYGFRETPTPQEAWSPVVRPADSIRRTASAGTTRDFVVTTVTHRTITTVTRTPPPRSPRRSCRRVHPMANDEIQEEENCLICHELVKSSDIAFSTETPFTKSCDCRYPVHRECMATWLSTNMGRSSKGGCILCHTPIQCTTTIVSAAIPSVNYPPQGRYPRQFFSRGGYIHGYGYFTPDMTAQMRPRRSSTSSAQSPNESSDQRRKRVSCQIM